MSAIAVGDRVQFRPDFSSHLVGLTWTVDREARIDAETGKEFVGISMPGGFWRLAYTDDLIKVEGERQ